MSHSITVKLFSTLLLLLIFSPATGAQMTNFGLINASPEKPVERPLVSRTTHVTMPDGVRLAIDYTYPDIENARFPTVIWFTRYWRSLSIRLPSPKNRAPVSPRRALPDFLLADDYAVVSVDIRGTGASEGQWLMPWSEAERSDYAEIIKWITNQPWSDGNVTTLGLSYDGTAAAFATLQQPGALKAVAAQQIEFDLYRDVVFPGGIFNEWFVKNWSEANNRLDRNKTASFFPWYAWLLVQGVRPVGEDKLEIENLIKTRDNSDVYEALRRNTYRDDSYGNSDVTLDDLSVFKHRDAIERSRVPLFIWGSWLDGATADTVIRTFTNLNNPQDAVIGAWDHMLEHDANPYSKPGRKPVPGPFGQWGEIRQFFDDNIRSENDKTTGKKLVYYTLGEEQWKVTDTWPLPNTVEQVLHFSPNHRLDVPAPKTIETYDEYQIDFDATTGTKNRWHTELAKKVDYGNRARADKRLLTYTSYPLEHDAEITGYPIVDLYIKSSATDGAFYVYLEDVHPDGNVTYITDGQLRALHRTLSDEQPPYTQLTPYHSYKRADGAPLVPDEITHLRFALQPTSVLIKKDHRIRVAIAGHDKDTFARIPAAGDPVIKVYRDKSFGSKITLPVVTRQ